MSVTDKVLDYLTSAELKGITIQDCADHFNVSASSLRQQLYTEDTSFTELLDLERKTRCDIILLKRKPWAGIIQLATGYESHNTVTRAFRRWYGTTLKNYKLQQKINARNKKLCTERCNPIPTYCPLCRLTELLSALEKE